MSILALQIIGTMPTNQNCLAVVIADLHLSENTPKLNSRFLQFVNDLTVAKVYILGDFFEVWYGDNFIESWAKPIIAALQQATANGTAIYFQHGNRDFLIGNKFCGLTGLKLINEDEYLTTIGDNAVIFMHGDSLCTDDVEYQRFRKIVRNPMLIFIFTYLPKFIKKKIASCLRENSKKTTKLKAAHITDVNQQAVAECLTKHNRNILIHGHTHRPNIHTFKNCTRYVLGDWGNNSWWLEIYQNKIDLKHTNISNKIIINGDNNC